ncbi:hypothetical protein [Nonomuraea sp. NPDC046570]|uniref:hypothetical protein n=1 Tax=Nonomuraea sp. NPDC046570 TaxID=3155255 RepID=UPI0033C625C1
MKRRVLALAATAFAAILATSTPAHAETITQTHGPLSIGGYCAQQINSSAWIGLYELHGLKCYTSAPTGGLQFVGWGSPQAACEHLTPGYTITSYARAYSDAITCTGTR